MTVGEVGESILLVCRNVSEQAREVDWFHGVPGSIPPLVSSKLELPQDARLSLVDNTSLRITELRLQDEGNYTCKEVLNQTAHEHRVQLLIASKSLTHLCSICWLHHLICSPHQVATYEMVTPFPEMTPLESRRC